MNSARKCSRTTIRSGSNPPPPESGTHIRYGCLCVCVHLCVCARCVCIMYTMHVVRCLPQVNLNSGTNILYWRTTGILDGGKMVKPVLLKNIQIEGEDTHTHPHTRSHTHSHTFSYNLTPCVAAGVQCFEGCPCVQVWLTHQNASGVGQAGSAPTLAPPPAKPAHGTLLPARGPAPARRAQRISTHVCTACTHTHTHTHRKYMDARLSVNVLYVSWIFTSFYFSFLVCDDTRRGMGRMQGEACVLREGLLSDSHTL